MSTFGRFWVLVVAVVFILKLLLDGYVSVDHAMVFMLVMAIVAGIGFRRFLRPALAIATVVLFLGIYGVQEPVGLLASVLALVIMLWGLSIMIGAVFGQPGQAGQWPRRR